MRSSLPKILLAAASLMLVLALVWFDRDKTSPGPLSSSHAGIAKLDDEDGCDQCHDSSDLVDDCTACHEDVGAQLESERGFHGKLAAADRDACAKCHQEHHGDALPPSGDHAFELAGFANVAAFDHSGLDYRLLGKHTTIACKDCHRSAEVPVLKEGEKRFLGLQQACASCHDDVHKGKFGVDCASCHGQEHPFKDAANFVHLESFPLVGGHAKKCEECHDPKGPSAMELVKGQPSRTCNDCHENRHRPEFLSGVASLARVTKDATCALCHDSERGAFRADSETMPGELHAASGFGLEKPHERAKCAECHAPELATFVERYPGRKADACADCHGDPHRGEFDFGTFRGAACIDCHARDSFDTHSFDVEDHGRTAFALTGAHTKTKCDDCHAPLAADVEGSRDFRTDKQTCEACHVDVHKGEFARLAALRGEPAPVCADCHGTEEFARVELAKFDHAKRTRFELEGAHQRAECEACHPKTTHAEFPQRTFGFAADRFPGPSDRCDTCHADVHGGAFDRAGVPSLVDGTSTCGRCHDVERFRGELARAFDHSLFTGFELRGGHQRATCEACHGEDPSKKRALGKVVDKFRGSSERCETCHADPHEGHFDHADSPKSVDGRVGCARCHDVDSFRALTSADFDHARWTGFALDQAHARAACEACHVPTHEKRKGMRLGRSAGSACADCHEDPHAGQFTVAAGNDCARCHLDSGSFATLDFDHDRDSRFKLDAQHVKLECAACHRPVDNGRRASVVRYKPLGVECIDCHRPTDRKSRPDDSDSHTTGRVEGDDR
ncbi:MAG: hypothetical protein HZA52_16690 [Planctomycetes bacterium]|nr:hypothetical protein [Planctomycetota bacterium]